MKIEYDMGYSYFWDIWDIFDYKNFVVCGVGIDVLFQLYKGGKPFYFTAEAWEGEKDSLPERALFDKFYATELIDIMIIPSEEEVICIENNYPEAIKAFAQKFDFSASVVKYYLQGTFLPSNYMEVPFALNGEEISDSEGNLFPYLDTISLLVTREEFANVVINHKVHGYGEAIGYFTKERKRAY